jgi:hypothetical protein
MDQVPEADRQGNAEVSRSAPDRRQLRDAQTSRRSGVVEKAPAVPHALHSDQFVVAQRDRTPSFSVDTFRDITHDRIRNGVFRSVNEHVDAIMEYVEHHNADPKTFVWAGKAEDILAKVARAKASLDKDRSA